MGYLCEQKAESSAVIFVPKVAQFSIFSFCSAIYKAIPN